MVDESIAGKTILLVEDEPLIALNEKRILEQYGFMVTLCHSGEEAVNFILVKNEVIDLILMDINLGTGLDGTDAARLILQEKELPIIFLSSHTEREIVEKTENITSYGYIVKNLGETVLLASIKMAFRLYNSRQAELRKESEILVQEERYKRLIEGISPEHCVFSHTLEGIFTYASEGFSMFGISAADIIGKNWRSINLTKDSIKRGEDTDKKIMETGERQVVLLECIHPDNSSRFIEVAYGPVYENDCVFGMEGICTDVTIRQREENNLLRQKKLLNKAQELAHIGHWAWDVQNSTLEWSDEVFRIFGVVKEDFPVSVENFENAIHPDDLLTFKKQRDDMLAREDESEIVHRIVLPNNITRTVVERSSVIRNDAGDTLFVMGTIQDITERMEIENALRVQIKEKELILHEIHHRIKNNIVSIESLIHLKAESASCDKSEFVFKDILGRIGSMRLLYDLLLQGGEYDFVSSDEYVSQLCNTIMDLYSHVENISLKLDVQELKLTSKLVFSLGVILNELLTNSLKHAFIHAPTGEIAISVHLIDNALVLIFCDNGIGISSVKKNDSNGFGITLVRMLTTQMQGELHIDGKSGTNVEIRIPMV